MRILFTLRGASGHLHPLIPLAQVARGAGHEVAFGMPPAFRGTIEGLGFRWMSAGLEHRPDSSPEWAQVLEQGSRLRGRERRTFYRRGMASVLGPHMVADLLRICQTWRPDLFVRDTQEYGGCIAAAMLGIPHAAHEAVAFAASMKSDMAEPLAELRSSHGLPPDPAQEMAERYLVLSPFPPSLDGSNGLVRPTRHSFQRTPFDRSDDEQLPDWALPIPDAPVVYATLGTAVNDRTSILRAFIDAFRDERVNLIATVGHNRDPLEFGPQPHHVRVERYVPQSLLFPRCDLVVSHGGSNTMLTALAHAIPQVMVPIAADQPENAELCAAAGVARVVPPDDATASSIREAALAVLADPSYRRNAERIRDEIATLPGTDHAVALLERLARGKAPIIASR